MLSVPQFPQRKNGVIVLTYRVGGGEVISMQSVRTVPGRGDGGDCLTLKCGLGVYPVQLPRGQNEHVRPSKAK